MTAARNPATLARLRTELALVKNDLERRGIKPPKQVSLEHRLPVMWVDGKQYPTFVVARAEDYIAGKVSLWSLVRTIDGETMQQILDFADARRSGHIREPNWAEEVMT